MPRDRGLSPSVQRVLVCLYLCGLSLTSFALPVTEERDNQIDKQMQLSRIMYRLGNRGQSSPYLYNQALLTTDSEQRRKRFGIAGLDNVDVITSILDQQRARKKPRRPAMSLSLSLQDIQRLMDAGR